MERPLCKLPKVPSDICAEICGGILSEGDIWLLAAHPFLAKNHDFITEKIVLIYGKIFCHNTKFPGVVVKFPLIFFFILKKCFAIN